MIGWLREKLRQKIGQRLLSDLAQEILIYNGFPFQAARSGTNLEFLRSVEQKFPEFYHEEMTLGAACCESEAVGVGILEWLKGIGATFNELPEPIAEAASWGNLETMKWLRREGSPLDEEAFTGAVVSASIPCCEWLLQQACPWDPAVAEAAAHDRTLPILEWLIHHGCPIDPNICVRVSAMGRARTLKWLHASGYQCGEEVSLGIVCSGNLDLLIWANASGIPWNREACLGAAINRNYTDIINWINAQMQT